MGTQVTCVGVFEDGTYMYGGVPVCLSVVVVPTPRLVRILCALSCGFFTSMRRINSYSWLVVSGLLVEPPVKVSCLMYSAGAALWLLFTVCMYALVLVSWDGRVRVTGKWCDLSERGLGIVGSVVWGFLWLVGL